MVDLSSPMHIFGELLAS